MISSHRTFITNKNNRSSGEIAIFAHFSIILTRFFCILYLLLNEKGNFKDTFTLKNFHNQDIFSFSAFWLNGRFRRNYILFADFLYYFYIIIYIGCPNVRKKQKTSSEEKLQKTKNCCFLFMTNFFISCLIIKLSANFHSTNAYSFWSQYLYCFISSFDIRLQLEQELPSRRNRKYVLWTRQENLTIRKNSV